MTTPATTPATPHAVDLPTGPFAGFDPELARPELPQSDISYAVEDTPVGRLLLAVRSDGRLVTSAYVASESEESAWLQRVASGISPRVLRMPRALDAVRRELEDYLAGRLTQFTVVPDLALASEFQRTVLEGLSASVDYGSSTTYGALAAAISRPKASRAVGSALGANPVCVFVPCHRVLPAGGSAGVGAVGEATATATAATSNVGGYAGGQAAKAYLLALESRRSAQP